MEVKKAILAVAGFGTRFLPATKVVAKELLPIVDRPVVQYLVEEAVNSGIRDIMFVTRSGSQGIADHFDSSRDLEIHLAEQKKADYLKIVQDLPKMANFAFVRQARHLPYGNGTPILAAKDFIGRDEPFVYMFGDDVVFSNTPCVQQLIDVYKKYSPLAVIAFQKIPLSESYRYGMAKLKPNTSPPEMESIIEKPAANHAPSDLAQVGRFVFSPRIIEILESINVQAGNELYLTHAVDKLAREGRVLVHSIEGKWHTTGDPLPFLITNIECALGRKDLSKGLAAYLRTLDLSKF